MWKARMFQALPKIAETYPAARWVFLTLTVRNCPVEDLRAELARMGQAWRRLTVRKEFRDVLGWVKSIEITRGADGSAHPHIHALLLVKSTYFKPRHYVAARSWAVAWRGAGRLDYLPVIDVRIVKSRGAGGLTGAVAETLKYAVKPATLIEHPAWLLEYMRQVRRTRAVASGGVLAGLLRDEASAGDLLEAGEEGAPQDGAPRLTFNWRETIRRYQRRRA